VEKLNSTDWRTSKGLVSKGPPRQSRQLRLWAVWDLATKFGLVLHLSAPRHMSLTKISGPEAYIIDTLRENEKEAIAYMDTVGESGGSTGELPLGYH